MSSSTGFIRAGDILIKKGFEPLVVLEDGCCTEYSCDARRHTTAVVYLTDSGPVCATLWHFTGVRNYWTDMGWALIEHEGGP